MSLPSYFFWLRPLSHPATNSDLSKSSHGTVSHIWPTRWCDFTFPAQENGWCLLMPEHFYRLIFWNPPPHLSPLASTCSLLHRPTCFSSHFHCLWHFPRFEIFHLSLPKLAWAAYTQCLGFRSGMPLFMHLAQTLLPHGWAACLSTVHFSTALLMPL